MASIPYIKGQAEISQAIDDKSLSDAQRIYIVMNAFNNLADSCRFLRAENEELLLKNSKLRKQIKTTTK